MGGGHLRSDIIKIIESWACREGNVNTTEEIINRINNIRKNTKVSVEECSINDDTFWFYDDYNGEILNRKRSFFSIRGIRRFENDCFISEQPVIFQQEIGYLGIICKEINGVINFLMQAKIEPGNINCVQISPTIQATKSNFTRVHGGKLPAYFSYFERSERYNVIYDQIQSEQSSRFYKKRNRNIIIEVEDELEVTDNYIWMTLGQIKDLLRYDNLVNMDTRTVISGIPLSTYRYTDEELVYIESMFCNKELFKSIFLRDSEDGIVKLYHEINNYKMFYDTKIVKIPLNDLMDWRIDDTGVYSDSKTNFVVKYYKISIEGREVQNWIQPLFKATGFATFGLIIGRCQCGIKFLVCIRRDMGTFDACEVGPSIQLEANHDEEQDNSIDRIFRKKLEKKEDIIADVMLSEEGGRFYFEENRNVVMLADIDEIGELPEFYLWVDYSALNVLAQVNNCLNIQLRNLLCVLDL